MATEKNTTNLVINQIENTAVFNYMKEHNLINEDELYLVEGENTAVLFTPQTLSEEEKVQARANIGIDDAISAAITGTMEASY